MVPGGASGTRERNSSQAAVIDDVTSKLIIGAIWPNLFALIETTETL